MKMQYNTSDKVNITEPIRRIACILHQLAPFSLSKYLWKLECISETNTVRKFAPVSHISYH